MSPEFLWQVAEVSDFIHTWIVTPLILMLPIYYFWIMNKKRYQKQACYVGMFVSTVFGLQAVYLNCPMLVFSHWLRGFKDPRYNSYQDSWVHAIYEKVGPMAMLHWPIAGLALAMLVYSILQLRKLKASQNAPDG